MIRQTFAAVTVALSFLVAPSESAQFDSTLKNYIVSSHNDYRRNQISHPAADMMEMEWSNDMANKADSWARQCVFGHSTNNYGQNIYSLTNFGSISKELVDQIMHGWGAAEREASYQNVGYSSGGPLGGGSNFQHYTQIIWGKTRQVGCAYALCSGNKKYIVCNYFPAGNVRGQGWYEVGTTCSRCPRGSTCVNKLCSTRGRGGRNNDDYSNDHNTTYNNYGDNNYGDNNYGDNNYGNNNDGNNNDNNNYNYGNTNDNYNSNDYNSQITTTYTSNYNGNSNSNNNQGYRVVVGEPRNGNNKVNYRNNQGNNNKRFYIQGFNKQQSEFYNKQNNKQTSEFYNNNQGNNYNNRNGNNQGNYNSKNSFRQNTNNYKNGKSTDCDDNPRN